MPVPAEISQLVELFERNYDQYGDPAFTEAAVRHRFIDPLFIALGWDVNNVAQIIGYFADLPDCPVALHINFGRRRLEYRRLFPPVTVQAYRRAKWGTSAGASG